MQQCLIQTKNTKYCVSGLVFHLPPQTKQTDYITLEKTWPWCFEFAETTVPETSWNTNWAMVKLHELCSHEKRWSSAHSRSVHSSTTTGLLTWMILTSNETRKHHLYPFLFRFWNLMFGSFGSIGQVIKLCWLIPLVYGSSYQKMQGEI